RESVRALEANALAEARAANARSLEVLFLEVDAEKRGAGVAFGEAHDDLAGAAAHVEHLGTLRQIVAREDGLLLRPDGLGLRGQGSHHRLVGHLAGLRAARVHASASGIPSTARALGGVSTARRAVARGRPRA